MKEKMDVFIFSFLLIRKILEIFCGIFILLFVAVFLNIVILSKLIAKFFYNLIKVSFCNFREILANKH
ncbi:MAG: hypothetical protein LBT69_05380 [Lactobacillales bacterium]|jgi:hypothetical protein|nr:hypothetical protein [Lactobacillales bacterium]